MKKRVLSLLLALIMCFTMVPVIEVSAAEDTSAQATTQNYSDWVLGDLVTGDSYGIYPMTWYTKDMTAPITQGQLRVLLAGFRVKLLETECVTKNPDPVFDLTKKMSVEKVIDTFYYLISSLEYSKDIGTKEKAAVDYMKENGVYTGANGELALSDTCSIEQACVIATRLTTCLFDKLDAASKGFLWEVKSGNNKVYMLGSIHLADTKIYPFSKEIRDAYQSSDALVEEVNLTDTTGPLKLATLGVYTDGTTLKDHVSSETYQKILALVTSLGISESDISLLKPWYLYASISALAFSGADASQVATAQSLGIDINFTANAYLFGKPIMEVEGYEYQGKVFDSFSDKLQEVLLSSTIDQINMAQSSNSNDFSSALDTMLNLWHEGDLEGFKQYASLENDIPEGIDSTEKALYDEYYDKLFTQRDKGMADYIDNLLKADGGKTYFVVMGSFHYVSNYSVLDILKSKGYEVTRIN